MAQEITVQAILADIQANAAEAEAHPALMERLHAYRTLRQPEVRELMPHVVGDMLGFIEKAEDADLELAIRSACIELVRAAAFLLVMFKAEQGEELSPARFAMSAYEIAARTAEEYADRGATEGGGQ